MSKSTLYFAFVALWIILRVLYVKAIFSPNIKGTPKGKNITVKYKIIADRKHNISRLNLILSFGFIIRFSIAFLLIKNQNKFKKPSERIDKAINERNSVNLKFGRFGSINQDLQLGQTSMLLSITVSQNGHLTMLLILTSSFLYNFSTILLNWAISTIWFLRFTNVLPMGYDESVYINPVF